MLREDWWTCGERECAYELLALLHELQAILDAKPVAPMSELREKLVAAGHEVWKKSPGVVMIIDALLPIIEAHYASPAPKIRELYR